MISHVSDLVIPMLCAIIGYQQWFWSKQVQKLIDKVMSRNYAEYAHSNAPPPPLNREFRMDLNQTEDLSTLDGILTR